MRMILAGAGCIFALGGCDGTGVTPFSELSRAGTTASSFQTPDAAGAFPSALADPSGRAVLDANGRGFAYQVGTNATRTGVGALAGVVRGAALAAAPTRGSAVMTGDFRLRSLSNPTVRNGQVSGTAGSQAGTISLTADFANRTLKGSAGGLSVNGRFAGGELSGTVTYNGLPGALTGVIGADQAIGAFHGASRSAVMAGGFLTSR